MGRGEVLKAFAVKAVAAASVLALLWFLPPVWELVAAGSIVIATVGFFTYTIAHPSSQFFAPVLSRLATHDPNVALTFDDGPDPVVTPRILDVLRSHRARATFFVLGDRAARYPELIRRIHDEGHTVGT